MPSTSRGRDSRKNNGPKAKAPKGKAGAAGGMIDVLAAYDTRHVKHHHEHSARGNGPHPTNLFGRTMKKPRVGAGGP